jgi:hemolysin III
MNQAAAQTRPKLRGVIHLVATFFAIPAVIWLVMHAARGVMTAGTTVYGIFLVLLFGVSAAYHMVNWSPPVYAVLKRVDRSVIFLFMGGSYTPFLLGAGGTAVELGLPIVWVGVILGVAKTVFWRGTSRWLTSMPYVVLGWIGLPFIPALYRLFGPFVFGLIVASGLVYTIGAVVYARRWPNPVPTIFGFHELFHVLVVVAVAAHYVAVWYIVVP